MKISKSKILKNIENYEQLITIFEEQKDYVAKSRAEANLFKWRSELKNLK